MKQRILTLAALACMLLTLAACGGGEQTADPGTTAQAAQPSPAACWSSSASTATPAGVAMRTAGRVSPVSSRAAAPAAAAAAQVPVV